MCAATNKTPSDRHLGVPTPKVLSAAESNATAASFAGLTSKLDYLSATDLQSVRMAYRFSDQAHLGQLRNSGEPYITHPIAVAAQCAEWKLDAQALMAALLHDAMEDCAVTKPDLIERFGSPVAELVDGLTKLEKLQFNTREENQAESFRKMLLAMARDVRVILIKLADRTHNMRTLADAPRAKWGRIASETLDVYAPIAHRLGLNQTYRELQDLAGGENHDRGLLDRAADAQHDPGHDAREGVGKHDFLHGRPAGGAERATDLAITPRDRLHRLLGGPDDRGQDHDRQAQGPGQYPPAHLERGDEENEPEQSEDD